MPNNTAVAVEDSQDKAAVAARRAARDLLLAARRRPLPRVKASTFSNIMALTARYEDAADQAGAVAARQELAAAWSAMLQRPCPKECQFESDAEVGYLRMGSALCEDDGLIRGHQVVLQATGSAGTSCELQDGYRMANSDTTASIVALSTILTLTRSQATTGHPRWRHMTRAYMYTTLRVGVWLCDGRRWRHDL